MPTSKQKQEVLSTIYNAHHEEIGYHRDLMTKVSERTTAFLLALGTGIIAIGHDRWSQYGLLAPIFITIGVVSLWLFTFFSNNESVRIIEANVEILMKVQRITSESPEIEYPEKWRQWGGRVKKIRIAGFSYYLVYNNILLIFLGALVMLLGWQR